MAGVGTGGRLAGKRDPRPPSRSEGQQVPTGPQAGEYGEPELAMVLRVMDPEEVAWDRSIRSQSKKPIRKPVNLPNLGQRPRKEDARLFVSSMSI